MKRIEIIWRDSKRYTYQMSPDENFEVCTIQSIGWLVEESKRHVVICQDDIEGDIRGVLTIPRENIVKIKRF